MKLRKLCCPNCKGDLELKVNNNKQIFCPYCGQKFYLDDEKKEYTINKNININKNIKYTSWDEADVIRATTEAQEKKNTWIFLIGWAVFMAFCFLYLFIWGYIENSNTQKSINAGMISAGSDEEYKGEHYEAVEKQLKSLGFKNITLVDLDDSGIVFWKSDKVESVSIGGETDFSDSDLFDPNSSIIVKYH